MNIAILASGRGSNARELFERKKNGEFGNAKIVGLISDKSDSPSLEIAKEFGVQSLFIDTQCKGARISADAEKIYCDTLKNWNIDLVVLAGFMKILPPNFVETFSNRVINLHPSLLPSFKGKDAIKQAFDAAVKICGCTVHFVNNELDGGKIIAQKAVEILPEYDLPTLEEKVHEAEHILLPSVIEDIVSGKIKIG